MSIWIIIGFLGTVAVLLGIVLIGRHVIMGWHLATFGNALIATGAVGVGYWPPAIAALAFIALNFCNAAKWRREQPGPSLRDYWRNYIGTGFWKGYGKAEPGFYVGGWETPADGRLIKTKNHRRWTSSLRPAGHDDVMAFGERLGAELEEFPAIGALRVSEDLWDRWDEMVEMTPSGDHPDGGWGLTGPIMVDPSFEGLEARWDYWMSLQGAHP